MSFEMTLRGIRLRHELKRMFGEQVIELLADSASIADIEGAFPIAYRRASRSTR